VRNACQREFNRPVSGGRRFHGSVCSCRSSTGITDGTFWFGSRPDQPCAQDGKRVFSAPVGRTRRGGMEQRERDSTGGASERPLRRGCPIVFASGSAGGKVRRR